MTAKPVVAAADGSAGSLRAIEWAVREAVLRGAPLRIISAASLPKMVLLPLQPERDAALGFVRAHRDRALTAAAARAAEMAPGLRIDTDPVQGPAAPAVAGSGSGALMLVVGSGGIGAFAATVLGSVARYVADHASCPVAVVRDQTAAARRLVGVGVGDLDDCDGALAFAFEEAALRRAGLIAIHAWHAPQAGTFRAGNPYPPPGLPVAAAAAARQFTLLMDTWRQKYPDVPVRHDVVPGHPGRALAGLSARAGLVVIGRHAERFGLQCPGSVRHAVLNHAHGPVAVVASS
jgi:nucleotide-binding universal stress UspA family protein